MCYVKTAESDLLFLYAGLIYYSIAAEKKKAGERKSEEGRDRRTGICITQANRRREGSVHADCRQQHGTVSERGEGQNLLSEARQTGQKRRYHLLPAGKWSVCGASDQKSSGRWVLSDWRCSDADGRTYKRGADLCIDYKGTAKRQMD